MRFGKTIAGLGFAITLAGCQTFQTDNMSVADYCVMDNHMTENVCQLSVEIDGQKTALANTDMKLSEARSLASAALSAANKAQTTAEGAQTTASQALSRANSAILRQEDLMCETRTIRQSKVGTCRPDYILMSCTQTHYTTRSGGESILREINDQQCRYQSQVLEMQVRCCALKTETTTTSTTAYFSRN